MITVPAIGTLSHRLLNQLGTAGRRTMDKVAELNALSTDEINHKLHPGDEIQLPYVSNYYPYVLKTSYRAAPTPIVEIRSLPGYTSSTDQTNVSLIAEASSTDCTPTADDSKWPFDTAELRNMLLYNNTKRAGPPMQAVIGVADTGIDRNESRLFLHQNMREIPNNNIDDEPNGYVDDFDGVNMNRGVPGFPALNNGFKDKNHGTHVAGLVLGGLKDSQLTQLVKERISLRIINIVHTTVIPTPAGNLTSWPIPNDAILDTLQYAQQEPQIPIINLSVESAYESGLDRMMQFSTALIVAAAGNHRQDLDLKESYPAAATNRRLLLSVGAYDGSDGLAPFSNRGANKVDLAAPGCLVDSIVPGSTSREKLSGTSQAAPLVSFAAGLLYSERVPIPQIKNRILLTTDYDPDKLGDCSAASGCVQSEGRLNIARALDIYEDVVVLKDAGGGHHATSGRIQDKCLSIDGGCVALRSSLQRVVPHEGGGRCWFISSAHEVSSRSCKVNAMNFKFKIGSAEPQTIYFKDVYDLVPGIR
jgi:subtilisin family serine protease